jgi:site-specific DNA recombinase
MKSIGYVRVSSLKQVNKGGSIDMQINRIKEYCKYEKLELVNIVEELGVSGRKENRLGIMNMLECVKREGIDVVVVYSLSRLGRNLREVLDMVEWFKVKGVELRCIKEGIVSGDSISNLVLNIMGSINEFEVEQLGERIKDVKKDRKEKGKSYSNVMYGWENINGELVINKEEWKNRNRIKRLRKRGMSWSKIEEEFDRLGILSRKGNKFFGSTMRNMFESDEIRNYKKVS